MTFMLQNLKARTKLEFKKTIGQFRDEVKFLRQNGNNHFEEDTFSKNSQGKPMSMHEASLIKKFLQTQLQIKHKKI